MRNLVEKIRIYTTWFFGAVVLFLILFSKQRIEEISPLFDGLLMVVACCAAAIGAFGRLWASLYVGGYKNRRLITVGPYSLCRNPLYFFSFIGAVGVGFGTETITIPIVIAITFAAYYPFVVRAEEKRLETLFGDEFREYRKKTPAFLPNFARKIETPESWTVDTKLFTKRIFDALWFIFFIGFLEMIEAFHESGVLPTFFRLY